MMVSLDGGLLPFFFASCSALVLQVSSATLLHVLEHVFPLLVLVIFVLIC